MSRKITKKQTEKFNQEVIKILIENGFSKTYEDLLQFEKITKLGKVTVSLWKESFNLYSIFCRFENPKLGAMIFTECDSYNGKCNFHCEHKEGTMEMFDYFISNLTHNSIEDGYASPERMEEYYSNISWFKW